MDHEPGCALVRRGDVEVRVEAQVGRCPLDRGDGNAPGPGAALLLPLVKKVGLASATR